MIRVLLICCVALGVASTEVSAQHESLLGNGNFALKLDYLRFTGDHFNALDEDDGLYVGLEGFYQIKPNLYLGGELGQGTNITFIFGKDIQFYVFESNLKYARKMSSQFTADVGAGASYNYVSVYEMGFVDANREVNDWLVGGQIFVDVTYRLRRFTAGANMKYQLTQDFKDEGGNYSNIRIGLQFGYIF